MPNIKTKKCAANRNIKGVTLRERAALVLRIRENASKDEMSRAYRKLAKQHHPDMTGGAAEIFRVISEAYAFLVIGKIPKRPLLTDDGLISRITGRRIAPLVEQITDFEKYEQWHKSRYYGVGVV